MGPRRTACALSSCSVRTYCTFLCGCGDPFDRRARSDDMFTLFLLEEIPLSSCSRPYKRTAAASRATDGQIHQHRSLSLLYLDRRRPISTCTVAQLQLPTAKAPERNQFNNLYDPGRKRKIKAIKSPPYELSNESMEQHDSDLVALFAQIFLGSLASDDP